MTNCSTFSNWCTLRGGRGGGGGWVGGRAGEGGGRKWAWHGAVEGCNPSHFSFTHIAHSPEDAERVAAVAARLLAEAGRVAHVLDGQLKGRAGRGRGGGGGIGVGQWPQGSSRASASRSRAVGHPSTLGPTVAAQSGAPRDEEALAVTATQRTRTCTPCSPRSSRRGAWHRASARWWQSGTCRRPRLR